VAQASFPTDRAMRNITVFSLILRKESVKLWRLLFNADVKFKQKYGILLKWLPNIAIKQHVRVVRIPPLILHLWISGLQLCSSVEVNELKVYLVGSIDELQNLSEIAALHVASVSGWLQPVTLKLRMQWKRVDI
jgi:hypothetical protein